MQQNLPCLKDIQVSDTAQYMLDKVTGASVVTVYGVRTDYIWDYGLNMLPVCGPDRTPCEITKLHAETCFRVVSWKAQRRGQPCDIPSAYTGSPNEVLFSKRISLQIPGVDADQTQTWTVDGQYTYALRIPPAEGDQLAPGSQPLDPTSSVDNWIITTDFNKFVLAPVPSVEDGDSLQPLPFVITPA